MRRDTRNRRTQADRRQCRGRQELLVVRLRPLQDAAVLRRLAQGHAVLAARVQAGEDRGGLVLHLQAHRQRRRCATAAIRTAEVMPDLLLEFFSEEIPARMQARAAEDLKKLVTDKLVEAGLTYEGAKAFATPRRLALAVAGVPVRQPDVKEERKGPRVGAPEKAIAGFLKAAGLELDRAGQGAGGQEGRFLRRGDREARPARDRGDRRDRAGGGEGVSLAEVDALGRGLGAARARSTGCGRCIRSSRCSGRRPRSPTSCRSSSTASRSATPPTATASWRRARSRCAGSTTM